MAHRLAPLAAAAITTSALAATALALPAAAAAPPAPPAPVQVVAEGLDDPYGLGYANGKFYTAENLSGEISGIIPGGRGPSTRVSGYPGVTGVDRTRRELLFLTGESQDPEAEGGSTLYVSTPGGPVRALADLKAHELEHNPDGQRQFGDDGAPLDALSNPFSVVAAGTGSPDGRTAVVVLGARLVPRWAVAGAVRLGEVDVRVESLAVPPLR